jgi:pilus assembly protein Flp/PilA
LQSLQRGIIALATIAFRMSGIGQTEVVSFKDASRVRIFGKQRYFYLKFIRPVQRQRMIELVRKFWADETGATAIEYGLLAAGISLAIIAVVNGMGTKLNTKFTSINNSLK